MGLGAAVRFHRTADQARCSLLHQGLETAIDSCTDARIAYPQPSAGPDHGGYPSVYRTVLPPYPRRSIINRNAAMHGESILSNTSRDSP